MFLIKAGEVDSGFGDQCGEALFVMGEVQYREWKVWTHQNLLQRKDDLLEAECEQRETEVRMAREREEKIRRD